MDPAYRFLKNTALFLATVLAIAAPGRAQSQLLVSSPTVALNENQARSIQVTALGTAVLTYNVSGAPFLSNAFSANNFTTPDARARASGRGEAPPTAVWRLATRNRRRYGGYLVHAGICVMAIAIAISATMGIQATATLRPGEEMTLGPYRLRHERLVIEPLASDARVRETRAELMISGPQSGALTTALRDYPSSTTPIATPAVRSSFGEDLYVTLIAYDPDTGAATLRVFVNPLVGWIWLGGAIVALGAIFAAWPERHRRAAVVAAAGA